MKRTIATKYIAVAVNLMLVTSSFADVTAPALTKASAGQPDFVKAFTPPASLGYITDSYKGQTDKPVILIQDLHANYGVQKKIMGLLEFLQPKVSSPEKSMVLGVEGDWGEIDNRWFREKPVAVRKKAGDFLLKHAEIHGMELFAGLSDAPVKLIGIENPDDYLVHRSLFNKSLRARLQLANILDQLRHAVSFSKSDAPRALKRLWRMEESFRAGKLDLARMSKELDVQLNDYGQAERVLNEKKQEIVERQNDADQAFLLRNVVKADASLEFLARLLRYQLTFEEVKLAAEQLPSMLAVVKAFLPQMNVRLWNEAVRTSLDHYAVALLRDKPMAERAMELAERNAGASVVVVTGGFHTQGIAERLRAKKMSYVAIAPVVSAHTSHDEKLYLRRMLGLHVSVQEIQKFAKVPTSQRTLGPQAGTNAAPVAEGMGIIPGLTAPTVAREVVRAVETGQPVVLPSGAVDAGAAEAVEGQTPAEETGPTVAEKVRKVAEDLGAVAPKPIEMVEPPAESVGLPAVEAPAEEAKPESDSGSSQGPGTVLPSIGATLLGTTAAVEATMNYLNMNGSAGQSQFAGASAESIVIGAAITLVTGAIARYGPKKTRQDRLTRDVEAVKRAYFGVAA